MKILMPILLASFLFVGCERIEGQLNVIKDLKLKNSRGDTHILNIGTYSADIKAKTSKKITLRLNNDADEKFIFEHNGNIPDNGAFNIPSSVSGQPVDLSGSVVTNTSNGPVNETTEACTYQEPYQVCYPMPMGGVNCTFQYRTVYGRQWLRYYDRMTVKNVNLFVKAVNSNEESADFHGDVSFGERIILSQSGCR